MIKDTAGLRKKLHALLSARFDIVMYDNDGYVVDDPAEATRYTAPGLLVRVETPSDSQPDVTTSRIVFKTTQTLANDSIVDNVKRLADDYLMIFQRDMFGTKKTQVSADVGNNDDTGIRENDMKVAEGFGAWSGSTRTSYQPLNSVRIIVRHRRPVSEEVRGSRTRNIHSILLQHGPERFKLPENSIIAARAMARHLENGGAVYDSIGTQINEMATEYRQLREFLRYVRSEKLVNEGNSAYVALALETCAHIRQTFHSLMGSKGYAAAVDRLAAGPVVELNEDDGLKDHFTQNHLDPQVEAAFGSLRRAAARRHAFESAITAAVSKERFENLRDLLQETDGMEFEQPHMRLSHQVSRLSQAAQSDTLRGYLHDLSQKISAGGQLGQFDYGTLKSCLLAANNGRIQESIQEGIGSYIKSKLAKKKPAKCDTPAGKDDPACDDVEYDGDTSYDSYKSADRLAKYRAKKSKS